MARKAAFHKRRCARFAVREVTEPPAAGCGIFFRVLNHKLNVRRRPRHKRLDLAKDFVVFSGWDVTVVQGGQHGAVWKRKRAIAEGLDRYIVAEKGAQTVELACFMG